jgi:endonuclease/exonuclease/phosphatase family metal-dependent hydrolase
VLAWDDAVFALEAHDELGSVNVGGTVRAPLVGHLTHRASGLRLLFVVNHLWRTDEPARHEQARLLNAWGADQVEPVVMVGDYNLDWNVETGQHDRGYDELTADGVFEWVRPATLIETQCSGFDSVLDFVFVGGAARDWTASSEILRPSPEYCSRQFEETFSDHRPVRASFSVP